MPIYIIIVICLVLSSCARQYIDPPQAGTNQDQRIELTNIYSSVDFSSLAFRMTQKNVSTIQVQRSDIEIPRTIYDGELIFFNNLTEATITDNQLTPNSTYYYSIFYNTADEKNNYTRAEDVTLKTLSFYDGMHQTINELIQQAIALNKNLEFIVSAENLNFFLNDNAETLNSSFLSNINGILIENWRYKYNDTDGVANPSNQTASIECLKAVEGLSIFSLDYLSITHEDRNSHDSLFNQPDDVIISYVDPIDITGYFEGIPSNQHMDPNLSLADVKNFMLLDGTFQFQESDLKNAGYDLIIVPYHVETNWEESNAWLYESIQDLKIYVYQNEEKKRLIFANINVSKIWQNGNFWNDSWGEPSNRPDWLDPEILKTNNQNTPRLQGNLDYYVKYWRPDWKDYLLNQITKIANAGFDGIVFSGVDAYMDYQCKNDQGPKSCQD